MKRSASKATRKLAAQRRKISQVVLTFHEKVQQSLIDFINAAYQDAIKNPEASKVVKLRLDMTNPVKMAKLMHFGHLINQQIKHLPPMTVEQEKGLLEKLKTSLSIQKESLQEVKTRKAVHYENPHPLRATHMPDLYVGTQACAWETTENVGALYTKRKNAIKAFYDMLAKNAKILEYFGEGKISQTIEAFDKNLVLLKSLPPGPNKESEQERITYAEILTEYVGIMLQALKLLMQKMKQLEK
jgi:hypothetical protein